MVKFSHQLVKDDASPASEAPSRAVLGCGMLVRWCIVRRPLQAKRLTIDTQGG